MTVWGILGAAFAAVIASVAWVYQRAWERHEKRVIRYNEVMDRLLAFTHEGRDPQRQNELIAEHHRLWLFASDDVIRAGERFLDGAEGKLVDPDRAMTEYALAMRRDSTLKAALIPRFWTTKLRPDDFRLRSAKPLS